MAEAVISKQPLDANGNVVHRAMGLPKVAEPVLVSATTYVDVFDLSTAALKNRVFTSIAIRNPSGSTDIDIAFGEDFASTKSIACGTSQFFVLDHLMFGASTQDQETGVATLKVRAKLSVAQGSAATGTFTYAANPTDGKKVNVNGQIFEFSDDGSLADPSSGYVLVAIAASADLSWTALMTAINATLQEVVASINIGTNVLTLTSVEGGAVGNAITIADVDTGALASGATLSGASGGITPTLHIW